MHQETDLDLLKRGRRGDDAAFEELYNRHIAMVNQELGRVFQDPNDRDDLAEETFAKLFASTGPSNDTPDLGGYIRTVAMNAARSEMRRRTNKTNSQIIHHTDLIDVSESKPRVDPLVLKEQQEEIERILDELPPKQQAAVLGRLEGLSAKEIAERTGTNPNAVYQALSNAKKTLKGLFGKQEGRET